MTTILCSRNKGYHWTEEKHCHFKGYLQTANGTIVKGSEATDMLASLKTYDEFVTLVKEHYGCFSIILEKDNEIWLAVDIARSMPIYYSKNLEMISDDVDILLDNLDSTKLELDDFRLLEMYSTEFIGFENTAYSEIKQIELGCTGRISNGTIEQIPYYYHGKACKNIEGEYCSKLDEITSRMINRIVKAVGNRQMVLSLSGGYDSRYLACSLKKNGIKNVICYTYGRSDSFEVKQSKIVADALNYKWYNVEYSDQLIKSILAENLSYIDYSNRPDYIVYLQNYLAVKHLHDNALIPTDSVCLTGLCNDMPTGFYIPSKVVVEKYGYSLDGVAEYNVAERFKKVKLSKEAKKKFKEDIIDFLQRMNIHVKDYQSFVSALDCLETANFHSRCYLNMNTVHDFFGYEWMLPCWDRELLDFWYSIPAEDRSGQKVYATYVTEELGKKYNVGTKKYINESAKTPLKRKIKRKVGAALVKISYPLGIPIRRNTDINNMSVLEVDLYNHIKQKKAIISDRAALILLLTIYIMERRYGEHWYDRIADYLD